MPEILITVKTKRPAGATHKKLLELRELGLSLSQIRQLYPEISLSRISAIIKRARQLREQGKLG